jgi:uncharacterized RDD family membrane protein YckC
VERPLEPAAFGERCAAFAIDLAWAAVPAFLAALAVADVAGGLHAAVRGALVVATVLAVPPVAFALALAWRGTTPGKHARGLAVVGPDGGRIGPRRALRRELVGRLGVEHVLLGLGGGGALGYLWARRDRHAQAWHDHVAATHVVLREARPAVDPELRPPFAPREVLHAGGLAFAGYWERAAAFLLDSSLVVTVALTVAGAVGIATGAIDPGDSSGDVPDWFGWVIIGLTLGCGALYNVIGLAWRGTTVGKHAVGLVVVRADGSALRTRHAISREVLGRVVVEGLGSAFMGATAIIGHLMPVFDGSRQALHDKIGGTVVVRAARVDKPAAEPAHSAPDVVVPEAVPS